MRILAMFAAMVGALLIIFFPKYQKMPVIATWLLLVVISLFVPVGSKLMFQPLKADSVEMIGFNAREAPDQDGVTACSEKPQGCGFAPQLLAVHIGSVMQTITSDIFRSKAWAGLIERQTAATELYTMTGAFNLGAGWIGMSRDFKAAGCEMDLTNILSKTYTAEESETATPMTLAAAFSGLEASLNDKDGNFSTVPNYVLLPSDKTNADALKWDEPSIVKYEAGIKQLCEIFCDAEHRDSEVRLEVAAGGGSTASTISVANALTEMTNNGLFDVSVPRYVFSGTSKGLKVGPGAFIAPMGAAGSEVGEDFLNTRRCFVSGVQSNMWTDPSVQRRVQECLVNYKTTYNKPQEIADTYRFIYDRFVVAKDPEQSDLTNNWQGVARLLAGQQYEAFRNMPVGIATLTPQAGTADFGPSAFPIPAIKSVERGMSCRLMGEQIVDHAIQALKAKQKPNTFDKLIGILDGSSVGTVFDRVPSQGSFLVSDMTSIAGLKASDPELNNLVELMAIRMSEATRGVNQKMLAAGDKELIMRAAMVNSLLDLMMRVTTQATGLNYGMGANAAEDGRRVEPKLVGSETLTEWGGGLAFNLGKILAMVGAFFTGPLAAAFIQFLTVLVDFTLMVLITITPLLFIFGLLIPTAAAGVMTIAVMSVLILKFVPITLIILNGVGGMVYDLLPASVGANAGFTRDLLVLAMGGLYMNLVGLTFFLMFKLGDPSAFLGRLTALDGSAKQLAERGIAAAITVASAAAVATTGLLGGAAGALLGAGGGRITKAANAVADASKNKLIKSADSVTGGVTSAALGGIKEEDNKGGAGGGADGGAGGGAPKTPEQLAAEKKAKEEGIFPTTDSMGRPLDEDAQKKMRENADIFAEGTREGSGLTREEAGELAALGVDGSIVKQNADGTREKFTVGPNGAITSELQQAEPKPAQLAETTKALGTEVTAITAEDQTKLISEGAELSNQPQLSQTPPGAVGEPRPTSPSGSLDTNTKGVTETQNTLQSNNVQGPAGAGEQPGAITSNATDSNTIGVAETPNTAGGQPGVAAQGTAAAQGIPAQVTVMGGKLDDVGTVGAISSAATGSVQERIEARKADEKAEELNNKQKQVNELGEKVPAAKADLQANLQNFANGNITSAEMQTNEDEILKRHGTSRALEGYKTNMNQQIADRISDIEKRPEFLEIEELLEKVDRTDDAAVEAALSKKKGLLDIKKNYDALKSADTAALTVAELSARLGETSNLARAMELRGAADMKPGVLSSAASGLYGAFAGTGGGLSKIPVLGPAVAEAVNEFYEAPERARAWNASGGAKNWSSGRADAQRAGFYNKAMAHVPAAEQYANMSQYGGFQAQKDLAVQAAREAVERSRSQWGAQLASKKDFLTMEITQDAARKELMNNQEFVATLKDFSPAEKENHIKLTVDDKIKNGFQVQIDPESLNRKFELQVSQSGYDASLSADQLRGLGRMDAADRLVSVRQEAALMQKASMVVTRAKGGLDGNMLLREVGDKLQVETEEVAVALTPDLLNKFRGDLATKKYANNIDDMMISHYGLVEKQYLRGDMAWNATRNMNTSADAAATFARKDVSTDYLIGGHIKMVQGKERFLEGKGQYEMLVKYRNESNAKFSDEMARVFKDGGAALQDALKGAKLDVNLASSLKDVGSLNVDQRAKMEKWAAKSLKSRDVLVPLNAIFDEASSSGAAKYQAKAEVALYNVQAQADEVYGKWQKAAGAAYASAVPTAKDFTRNVRVDNNGVVAELGKASERLAERVRNSVGDRHFTQADKIVRDVLKKFGGDSLSVNINNSDKTAEMSIRADAMSEIISRIGSEINPDAAKAMQANTDGKTFLMEHGKAVFGRITSDGKVTQ
ncbi:MAG: hypothetical protein EOP52_13920 [Sphingobacteriales bacterium]|nr:MAG: hypothetical protein EOP52_13920 [Sphingobacteriales bacterium]